MQVNIEKKGTYVPKWNDNRELPEDEQIIIEYSNISTIDRRKFHKSASTKLIIDDPLNKSDADIDREIEKQSRTEIAVGIDTAGMVRAMKPMVKNCEDQDGNPIDTWEKLLSSPDSCGLSELIQECEIALSSTQKAPDSKN